MHCHMVVGNGIMLLAYILNVRKCST